MAYRGGHGGGGRVTKTMVQPINLIFKFLQNRTRVSIWLYEACNTRIDGHIIGFDEYMNLTLDNAEEKNLKKPDHRKPLGRILLRGESITLIQAVEGGS